MTKSDKENWKKRKHAEDDGIDLTPWDGLNVEHQNTLFHEYVKFILTAVLYDKDRTWDSEVAFGNGREADIVSFGPDDGKPVVYEVETDVTDARKLEKLNHFYHPYDDLIRDVIIIDPADVPRDPQDAYDYIEEFEVIG